MLQARPAHFTHVTAWCAAMSHNNTALLHANSNTCFTAARRLSMQHQTLTINAWCHGACQSLVALPDTVLLLQGTPPRPQQSCNNSFCCCMAVVLLLHGTPPRGCAIETCLVLSTKKKERCPSPNRPKQNRTSPLPLMQPCVCQYAAANLPFTTGTSLCPALPVCLTHASPLVLPPPQ